MLSASPRRRQHWTPHTNTDCTPKATGNKRKTDLNHLMFEDLTGLLTDCGSKTTTLVNLPPAVTET